jgi:quinoprotein glucose dehydrogenase
MLGAPDHGRALVRFCLDRQRDVLLRTEALQILGEWSQPHGQDRVSGLWRPAVHADAGQVAEALAQALPRLLEDDDAVICAAAGIAGAQHMAGATDALSRLVTDRGRGVEVRTAALDALGQFDDAALDRVVDGIGAEDPVPMRQLAVRIFARRRPAQAVPVLQTLLQNGSVGEQQAALQALGGLQHKDATALLGSWLERLQRGEVPLPLQLDLLEAAEGHAALQPQLRARAGAFDGKDPLAGWRECMEGGDVQKGRDLFRNHEATRCTRCHTVAGSGGNAGPVLDGVGLRRTREYLLQALVEPSAVICEGFASTVLQLHNGDTVAGLVVKEQDGVVEVMDLDGNTVTVPVDRIKSRTGSTTSAMPKMAGTLNRQQLRDVIAFLASLRQEPVK